MAQWQRNTQKSIDTSYQIYADILLQRNIGKKFHTDSLEICADSGASSCETLDEIYFIPGTYKHLNSVTINCIGEGLKVSGWGSVSWIFKIIRRRILNLVLNEFSILQDYQFVSFANNKSQNKQETLVISFSAYKT